MTVPKEDQFDPGAHLGFGDVAVDDPQSPSLMRITLKQSKTDPFRTGVSLFVGRTGTDLCPVAALLDYLTLRGSRQGPLFIFEDGRYLTRARFVEIVRDGLRAAGIDQDKYCGHSFRIGAATTAAAKGLEDSIIKTLDRWESLAYLKYGQDSQAAISRLLQCVNIIIVYFVLKLIYTHGQEVCLGAGEGPAAYS